MWFGYNSSDVNMSILAWLLQDDKQIEEKNLNKLWMCGKKKGLASTEKLPSCSDLLSLIEQLQVWSL